MKLVSMVDYVIENTKPFETLDDRDYYFEILLSYGKMKKYANFLKQPLKLEMFVPCVDGEPFNYSKHGNKEQYQKAQEKVLFKGFVYDSKTGSCIFFLKLNSSVPFEINFLSGLIEDLIHYNLELTENAIKKLNK